MSNDNDDNQAPQSVEETANENMEAPELEIVKDEPKEEAPPSQEEESFKDKYFRARADLENIQRRMRQERSNLRTNTLVGFTKELLPFIDNLDRALQAAQDDDSELVKGLRMNRDLLNKILGDNNISAIKSDGLFDANLHEAVTSIEDSEKPNNSIAAVLEIGYALNDRVIRYSKVQVTTGGPEAETPESNE